MIDVSKALVPSDGQASTGLAYTRDQVDIIKRSVCPEDISDGDFVVAVVRR